MSSNINPQGSSYFNNLQQQLNQELQQLQQYEQNATPPSPGEAIMEANQSVATAGIVFGALPSTAPQSLQDAATEYGTLAGQASAVGQGISALIQGSNQASRQAQ